MFTRLKALKVEIEHLQLLMDRAKVKLQKEFEAWWATEASSLQVRVAAGPCWGWVRAQVVHILGEPWSHPSMAVGEGQAQPLGLPGEKEWGSSTQAHGHSAPA